MAETSTEQATACGGVVFKNAFVPVIGSAIQRIRKYVYPLYRKNITGSM